MSKLPYKEGDIFAVPLENGGFALGVVARSPRLGKVLLGYFFNYLGTTPPKTNAVPKLRPESTILVKKFGDLFLRQGRWPIVGHVHDWDRRNWPMPSFIRRDPLVKDRAQKITYSEDDPAKQVASEPISYSDTRFEKDGLLGAGAVEIVLTQLAGSPSRVER